jgi:cell division protein FtsL
MSALAQGARAGRVRTRARATSASRRGARVLGGGVVWIVLFAGLLAGVVAVNVTVLRLNLALDDAGRERMELRGEISQLRSELSSAAATSRIERLAESELGLRKAEPEDTTYVQLRR